MAKQSAGIIVFRRHHGVLEVFIAHLGGPYWEKKDYGAWSFPKGEIGEGEAPFAAALREFQEETGQSIQGDFDLPEDKHSIKIQNGASSGAKQVSSTGAYAATLRSAPHKLLCRYANLKNMI